MRAASAVLAAALAAGCLLPQTAAEPRFFAPGSPPPPAADPPHRADAPELRVRRVRAAAYLKNRMVWRNGVEVGFYDLLRWTEAPARYAQEWLDDELFERRGFRRAVDPRAPQLVVRLSEFDELLTPSHEAAVTLDATLLGPDRETLFERSFSARKPIASDDPSAVADALGAALTDTCAQVGGAAADALFPR